MIEIWFEKQALMQQTSTDEESKLLEKSQELNILKEPADSGKTKVVKALTTSKSKGTFTKGWTTFASSTFAGNKSAKVHSQNLNRVNSSAIPIQKSNKVLPQTIRAPGKSATMFLSKH